MFTLGILGVTLICLMRPESILLGILVLLAEWNIMKKILSDPVGTYIPYEKYAPIHMPLGIFLVLLIFQYSPLCTPEIYITGTAFGAFIPLIVFYIHSKPSWNTFCKYLRTAVIVVSGILLITYVKLLWYKGYTEQSYWLLLVYFGLILLDTRGRLLVHQWAYNRNLKQGTSKCQ